MRGRKAPIIELSARQLEVLTCLVRQPTGEQRVAARAKIILAAAQGEPNREMAKRLGLDRDTVGKWRGRWAQGQEHLAAAEESAQASALRRCIAELLADAPRSGCPGTFTPEQIVQIIAIACEDPEEESERPVSHWTPREVADEAMKRKVVSQISTRTVGRYLNEVDLKPHLTRYWQHPAPEDPEQFRQEATTVCSLYKEAPALHEQGVHVLCCDEKTGMQALERAHPTLPAIPGSVERREQHYVRHGTQCLIANFEVATGQIVTPTVSSTRSEEDFANHLLQTVVADLDGEWIFITDNLDTHQSESLVCLVAELCDLDEDLGKKGRRGILRSTATRAAFLQDPSHRIRFVYTPKHASWLNQIELWFSILVRRLLKRASFTSVEDLQARVLAFIEYFNRTMAKPFKWTYTGRALVA